MMPNCQNKSSKRRFVCLCLGALVLASFHPSQRILVRYALEQEASAMVANPPAIAVFYNVFTKRKHVTLDIVREQMQLLALEGNHTMLQETVDNHFVVSHDNVLRGATLYYTMAGKYLKKKKFPCPTELFQECQLLEHNLNGSEANALQALYNYCQDDRHQHHSVIYMHTKGSFHRHMKGQDKLRKALTSAVYHCAKSHQHNNSNSNNISTCDICSLRFSPLPHWHASGNMFWATCQHIRRLTPPQHFVDQVDKIRSSKPPAWNASTASDPSLGVARFAYEHWGHTHSRVQPCDVLTANDSFAWGYPTQPETLAHPLMNKAQPAPHVSLHQKYWNELPIEYPSYAYPGLPPFLDLGYRLFEGCQLRGLLPQPGSWVWDFYDASSTFPNSMINAGMLEQLRTTTNNNMTSTTPTVFTCQKLFQAMQWDYNDTIVATSLPIK